MRTNAVSEGFNGVIQSLKNAARGFRSFAGYRVAILFHCGKLDLYSVNLAGPTTHKTPRRAPSCGALGGRDRHRH